MPPRPSQKRSAASSEDPSASKKTRFLEPSEDPVNFAEEVDSQLENPSATRRGRVKTEGYESDSSGDEDDVKPRAGKPADVVDDEDDMFAEAEKPAQDDDGPKRKEEKFLRLGDIEGQEFDEQKSGDEDEDDEDEPADEDEAERRKKKGMGYELSSFNMREEMEEGKFAEDGTYIKTFDPHAIHDRWMEGLDEEEIKKARKKHRERERQERERQAAEERELQQSGGKEAIEKQLLEMLKRGETVLEALQRLGAKAKKNGSNQKRTRPNNRNKPDAGSNNMDVDAKPAPHQPTDIERVTDLASKLMSFGDTDIYSKTWEEIVRAVRSSGSVDPSWEPPSADNAKYEFKWAVPDATAPEGQVFGPYSEDEMQAWYKAFYFGSAGEKVKVRKVGGEWGSWDEVL
ncbi:hypothetical protein GLOTRDRAFT_137074 [Gloeophyllum trabeum ATCC 11539]|uniref:GYF domain-containing protein n=1 Tax=Gloeophyllum trabeum (strain ATCC 11539 / FP-39264 / Madison 617) TaxID=670483 RepID=S7QET9_GLOTA|nr:uncharacterized protein GLOTRDRAFT_137074 [Gloeophyllum trabeum ATCC 11539]EPQ58336.1 hypothetical protein GLOTRDRAFT_137074 [Gloeophyllum trabeum ATCC 11539]